MRGGKESLATVERAVELAGEVNLPVLFLHVVNEDTFTDIKGDHLDTIKDRLFQIGSTVLSIAVSKSDDITTDGIIRGGEVQERILSFCHEQNADYLVLGKPRRNNKRSKFTKKEFMKFCKRVEKKCNARVVLI
jgi:nucleotide-binding universal stress UspA family protein